MGSIPFCQFKFHSIPFGQFKFCRKLQFQIKIYQFKFHFFLNNQFRNWNSLIQAKCVASVTNCSLQLETAMAPTINMGWQLFTNDKYWKYFSKLFHNTQRLRPVFQLNDSVFSKDLTQYLSRYNSMIEQTNFSRWMTQSSLSYSCWLVGDF